MRRFLVVAAAMALVVASCTSSETVVTTPAVDPTTSVPAPPPLTTVTTTTTQVVTTTTPVTTTTTSTTVPVVLPEPAPGWTRLDIDPELFGDVTLTGGVVSDGRMVLVGCENNAAGSRRDTWGFPVWVSDGDAGWRLADGPDGVGCVTQVEATPFGYFAVSGFGGLVLFSDDGLVWDRFDLSGALGLEGPVQLGSAIAVVPSPDGGRVTLLYSRAWLGESEIATLVTTTDGETWTEGPASSAALFDSSDFAAVIEGGPGLIAVGTSPGGQFVPTAAVFTSPDGLRWTRVTPRDHDFNDKTMGDVIAVDDGYVAVGGDIENIRLMTAWTSSDGVHWHRSPAPQGEIGAEFGFQTAVALTVVDGSIWVTGRDFDAARGDDNSDRSLPALWRSDDGIEWVRVDPETVTVAIPFVVIDFPGLRIGVWPPPFSLIEGPVQVFIADN
ncbi:hypothetical protein BMS3Bbin02_00488 [bacterium BMS3Bbin02]|nr:hypothetical protein BMS3Bbin02_00488 [bacterium BMS3Bbin02]